MKPTFFKKFLSLTILISLLFTVTACGNTEQSSDKLTIGMYSSLTTATFEDMREGFIQELAEQRAMDEDNVTLVYKNAQGDATNLNTICQEMVDSQVDLVAAIATPAAQAMDCAGK